MKRIDKKRFISEIDGKGEIAPARLFTKFLHHEKELDNHISNLKPARKEPLVSISIDTGSHDVRVELGKPNPGRTNRDIFNSLKVEQYITDAIKAQETNVLKRHSPVCTAARDLELHIGCIELVHGKELEICRAFCSDSISVEFDRSGAEQFKRLLTLAYNFNIELSIEFYHCIILIEALYLPMPWGLKKLFRDRHFNDIRNMRPQEQHLENLRALDVLKCFEMLAEILMPGKVSEIISASMVDVAMVDVAMVAAAPEIVQEEITQAFHAERDQKDILSETQLALLKSRKTNHEKWLALMPAEEDMKLLAAVLAITVNAPEDREYVSDVLAGNTEAIFAAILQTKEPDKNGLETVLSNYNEYSMRFVRKVRKTATGTALTPEFETPKQRAHERPHETLAFSDAVKAEITKNNLSEEDLKRAIIYGLRLTSHKAAIGEKYFQVEKFRRNVERILSKNGEEIPSRRETVENFLKKHRVISYYKNNGTVRLNITKNGNDEPDGIGKDILRFVSAWKNDFDRKTKTR